MPDIWPSHAEIVVALLIAVAAALHVVALGYWGLRLIRYQAESTLAQAVTLIALGFTLLHFFIWGAGYLNGLRYEVFAASTLAAIVSLLPAWPSVPVLGRGLGVIVRRMREEPILIAGLLVLCAFAIFSGLRGGRFEDRYKWNSPMLWAAEHHWVYSPQRISNGMEATEQLFTFAATLSSRTGAHWMHLMLWALLLMAGAALGRIFGAHPIAAMAAVAAIPAVSSAPATVNTDIPCAALLTSAFVCLFCGKRKSPDSPIAPSTLLASGLILAGAVSSKSFVLAGTIPFGLFVFFDNWRTSRLPRALAATAAVAAPALLVVLLWMLHTYTMLGHDPSKHGIDKVWDRSGQYFTRNEKDGGAAGRIPTVKDVIELPLVPFYATLGGQTEPYGSRIGLLTMTVSLLGIWMARTLPPDKRRLAYWLLAGALTYYFLLGPVTIKMRFYNFVWGIFAMFAAYAFSQYSSSTPKVKIVRVTFIVLALAGMTDCIVRKLILKG